MVQKVMIKTADDVAQEAAVRLEKTRKANTLGYIVRSPQYGKAGAMKYDNLPIHRTIRVRLDEETHQPVTGANGKPQTYEMDGGSIEMVNGEGFCPRRDWAEWIKEYWPEYSVIEVKSDRSTSYVRKVAQLSAIVDEALAAGQLEEDED